MLDVEGRQISQGMAVEALGGGRDGSVGRVVGGTVDGGTLVRWADSLDEAPMTLAGDFTMFRPDESIRLKILEGR